MFLELLEDSYIPKGVLNYEKRCVGIPIKR
jgi:hypothetical protein